MNMDGADQSVWFWVRSRRLWAGPIALYPAHAYYDVIMVDRVWSYR